MSSAALNKKIDHYIQLSILKSLYAADMPMSFSDLKDPTIENGLFTYHLNRLVDQSLVSKDESAKPKYSLTQPGAAIYNWTIGNFQAPLAPRLLINLIAHNQAGQIAISKRKGQPKDLLNTHMLPGGIVEYGQDNQATAAEVAKTIFGKDVKLEYRLLFENLVTHQDFMHHALIFVYEVKEAVETMVDSEHFEQVWVTKEDIATFTDAPFMQDIIDSATKGETFASRSYLIK